MPFTQIDPLVQRLLDAINVVGSDLSLPIVLHRIVEAARELVGARYAAVGVIGEDRHLSRVHHGRHRPRDLRRNR